MLSWAYPPGGSMFSRLSRGQSCNHDGFRVHQSTCSFRLFASVKGSGHLDLSLSLFRRTGLMKSAESNDRTLALPLPGHCRLPQQCYLLKTP
jgi:hypothetical protein